MKPNRQQLNQYLNYFTQQDFVDTFKSYLDKSQNAIRDEMESSHYEYEESSNWKKFLAIEWDDIVSVEAETDREYNDEGGYYPCIHSLTIQTKSDQIYCDYEWYESLFYDISNFSQYFYDHGIIRIDDVKPPFNLEIIP